jgi:hypothetical protein
MNDCYVEELPAHLHRSGSPRVAREHDRDVARLLSPWRRHSAGADSVVRRG